MIDGVNVLMGWFTKSCILMQCFLLGYSLEAKAGSDGFSPSVIYGNSYYPDRENEQLYRNDTYLEWGGKGYYSWNNNHDSLIFGGYFRMNYSSQYKKRGDIEQFSWNHFSGDWETNVGVQQITWGSTSGGQVAGVVNVINQKDWNNLFSLKPKKLGQPLINFGIDKKWGRMDVYAMVGFRSVDIPDEEDRPSPPVEFLEQEIRFEDAYSSSGGVDWAMRWSNSFRYFDVGISYFSGVQREPGIDVFVSPEKIGLIPVYDTMRQIGLELTYNWRSLSINTETAFRSGQYGIAETQDDYVTSVVGVSILVPNIFGLGWDSGLVLEYLYDERSMHPLALFEQDILVGSHLRFNDYAVTELSLALVYDRKVKDQILLFSASRRIQKKMILALEGVYINPQLLDDEDGGFLLDNFDIFNPQSYEDLIAADDPLVLSAVLQGVELVSSQLTSDILNCLGLEGEEYSACFIEAGSGILNDSVTLVEELEKFSSGRQLPGSKKLYFTENQSFVKVSVTYHY